MDILQRMPWAAQDAVFKRLSEIAEVADGMSAELIAKYTGLTAEEIATL